MKFDGTLGIRYTLEGKEYKEVIYPALAESDPEISTEDTDYWSYVLEEATGNERKVLFGSYGDDDCLSTEGVLAIKVTRFWDCAEIWIDDIDVISAEECNVYEEVNDKLLEHFSIFHSDLITRALTDKSVDKYMLLKGILQIVDNNKNDGPDEFTPKVFENV